MRVAGLLVVVGCAAPAPHPAVVGNTEAATGGAVRVIDAGREPRRRLRYDLRVGTRTHIELLARTANHLATGGTPATDSNLPTVREALELEVIANLPDGAVRIAWRVDATSILDDAPLDPSTRAVIEPAIALLVGLHGSAKLTARGDMSELVTPLDAPANSAALVDGLREMLARLYVPLPVEPVGVGATWEVAGSLSLFGTAFPATTRDQLLELGADGARWKTSVVVAARDQPFGATGSTGEIHAMTTRGDGELAWTPSQLVPFGHIELVSDGTFALDRAGQRVETTVHATVSLTARRVP